MSPLMGLTRNLAADETWAVLTSVKLRYLSESGSEAVRVKMVVPGAVFSPTSSSYVGWENAGRLSFTSSTLTTSCGCKGGVIQGVAEVTYLFHYNVRNHNAVLKR